MFQNLPILIIDRIILYVLKECAIFKIEYAIFLDKDLTKLLKQLSLTCRSWRLAAIAYLCERYYIRYPYKNRDHPCMRLYSFPYGGGSSFVFEPLVKTLHILVPAEWMATGRIPQNPPRVFENARKIACQVSIGDLSCIEEHDHAAIDANINAFLQHVRQLAPNTQDVYIRTQEVFSPPQIINPGIVKFIQRLAFTAKRSLAFKPCYNNDWIDLGDLTGLSQLTRMSFSRAARFQYMGAIRKCSCTLKFLSLELASCHSYSAIIVDDATDDYVVYPNMKYLRIEGFFYIF